MRPWYVAAAAAVLIGLTVGAFPAPGFAGPTAPAAHGPDTAAARGQDAGDEFESATVVSGLSVVVERAGERLVAGERTDYTIGVSNRGEQPQAVRVRVTVPPWMPEVTPHDGGQLGNGFVDWPLTVAPGQVTILRLTGAYDAPDRDTPTRVAFTACALGAEDNQPIVCATDIGRLETGGAAGRWWLIGLGIAAAVAAAAGAFLFIRRRRTGPRPPDAPPASTAASAEDTPLVPA